MWFESQMWPTGRCCGKCRSMNTRRVPNEKPMPYWCRDCRSYFSVRTGTAIARSKIPLKKWAIAIYLDVTSLKGISSMKLHRDIGVSQKAAWFMLHRIREAWSKRAGGPKFRGSTEVDKVIMGDRGSNKHETQELNAARGTVGKTGVEATKDHVTNQVSTDVVMPTDGETLEDLVASEAAPDCVVRSVKTSEHKGLKSHETVKRSVGESAREKAYTNRIESFWSRLKRIPKVTSHKQSPKHRYHHMRKLAGTNCIREVDTLDQVSQVANGPVGRRLMCCDLVSDIGLPSGARA